MKLTVQLASAADLLPWRDCYRHEMNCQVIHDSLHSRAGWTRSYFLEANGTRAGYGSIAESGPWQGKPTIFEFYVAPAYRSRVFDFFAELLAVSGATAIEVQSNDLFLAVLLQTFARSIHCESILFRDGLTTHHRCPEGKFRRARAADDARHFTYRPKPDVEWIIEYAGTVAAIGGILFHYNRPYGDLHMEVAEPFRARGFGCFLIQEMKRVCYEQGHVPGARCNLANEPSRRTLQKAGFVPCGNILVGQVAAPEPTTLL